MMLSLDEYTAASISHTGVVVTHQNVKCSARIVLSREQALILARAIRQEMNP